MVARAEAIGRTTRARTVHASHVFSQAHFRAYFIGMVKLAFVMPAIMRVAIPFNAVVMIGYLSVSSSKPMLKSGRESLDSLRS